MDTLWSMSTTIREAERIVGFIKTAIELDGEKWDKETQKKFQILLIKNRQYLNDPDNTQSFNKLTNEQANLLKDKSIDMTYLQAKEIFDCKEYKDPPMRGRQSMSPLIKLGLVYIVGEDKIITITDVGKKLANDEIDFSEFMFDSLLKFQYPNPYEDGFQDWNTKPFINALRLIKKVNELCKINGKKEKGISNIEFGIFVLSLKSYKDIDNTAQKVLNFREVYESLTDETDKKIYVENYINSYLSTFKNPVKNVNEYTDNMIRYMRLTKYIYIRGKYANKYVDLEPRRLTEINSILDNDDGRAKEYNETEWRNYMGSFGAYVLPFETLEKLTEIASILDEDIHNIAESVGVEEESGIIPKTQKELKEYIEERRQYRTKLQNIEIKEDYQKNIEKIDELIQALVDIRTHNKASLAKKYSIELERWANVGLNVLNDSILIKPNASIGDDGVPIYTAKAGVPDIECYYDTFNAVCEVTTLTNRDQWHNEGQPVMRHLREFEDANTEKPIYCLFIAPSLHKDTINTFFMSVKYEYEGKPQKIIPITIAQFEAILSVVKTVKSQGKKFKHTDMLDLYNDCIDLNDVQDSTHWPESITSKINNWSAELVG